MKATKAKTLFRGRERLNCAQAVLTAFQSTSGMADESIRIAGSLGAGRAEGAVCGALHAAKMLLDDPAVLQSIERDFAAKAGSLLCKQIRKLKELSCRDCVGLSAQLLAQHMEICQP